MPLIVTISNEFINHNYFPAESNYVSYKSMYLKIVQDSYPLCNWVLEKNFKDMDDVFDVNSFVDKIVSFFIAQTMQLNNYSPNYTLKTNLFLLINLFVN